MTTERKPIKRLSEKREAVTVKVRCRVCAPCHKERMHYWAARACTELALAERSWFLTLTFGPQSRLRIEAVVEREAQSAGYTIRQAEGFDPLPDLPRKLAASARREAQLFWKRLRKATGPGLRYFAALEFHKDGWPHIHALVHTRAGALPDGFLGGFPAANAVFHQHWGHGFTYTKAVSAAEPEKAFYVAKYVAKAGHRVSASGRYGRAGIHAPHPEPHGEAGGPAPPNSSPVGWSTPNGTSQPTPDDATA